VEAGQYHPEVTMTEAPRAPKFPKPKVLLMDLPAEVEEAVTAAGFNARGGTFGRPFKVPPSDRFVQVFVAPRLPNYAEQEIVVIDLTPPEPTDTPEGAKAVVDGEMDWWAKCSEGMVDPRPRVMAMVQDASHRIWEAGGVFVVFARPRLQQSLMYGMTRYREFVPRGAITEDNWSFLRFLDRNHLVIHFDHGHESTVGPSLPVIQRFLRRHQTGLEFDCTFRPQYMLTQASGGPVFFPLMANKYGDTIAGVVLPQKPGKGRVFILPQVKDKAAAVRELLQTVLPELSPHLFPFAEGGAWVRQEQYEHPGVLERRARQSEIQRKAADEVAQLEQEIDVERAALSYLHGLLTHAGDELVADVKAALLGAGLKQVIAVDEAEPDSPNKQEDLQVLDRSPALLVEVKGLAGQPTESDTLQVTKYVYRRMKQWGHTEVQGLSLVNHQRNLPALDRDHDNVFTRQQVEDAEQNGTGLITTWELFRLLRGKARWGWPDEAVFAVLYRTGRVPPYPAHYAPIGKVAKFWPDKAVVSIDIEGDQPLKAGDRVGFLLPAGFHEEDVSSLQVDRRTVQEAFPGQRAGHKTTLGKADVPLGTPVFRVGR
jgi:hypothetical protein